MPESAVPTRAVQAVRWTCPESSRMRESPCPNRAKCSRVPALDTGTRVNAWAPALRSSGPGSRRASWARSSHPQPVDAFVSNGRHGWTSSASRMIRLIRNWSLFETGSSLRRTRALSTAPDQKRARIINQKLSLAPVFWIWLLDAPLQQSIAKTYGKLPHAKDGCRTSQHWIGLGKRGFHPPASVTRVSINSSTSAASW
jgi:hypothetical protein